MIFALLVVCLMEMRSLLLISLLILLICLNSVDEVGQATILPKSELLGNKAIESSMLNATSKKQSYWFDYVVKTEQQPKNHFLATFFNLT